MPLDAIIQNERVTLFEKDYAVVGSIAPGIVALSDDAGNITLVTPDSLLENGAQVNYVEPADPHA